VPDADACAAPVINPSTPRSWPSSRGPFHRTQNPSSTHRYLGEFHESASRRALEALQIRGRYLEAPCSHRFRKPTASQMPSAFTTTRGRNCRGVRTAVKGAVVPRLFGRFAGRSAQSSPWAQQISPWWSPPSEAGLGREPYPLGASLRHQNRTQAAGSSRIFRFIVVSTCASPWLHISWRGLRS